mgnify:CR=1 FL=1
MIKKLINAIRGRLLDNERSGTADPSEKTGSPTTPVTSAPRPGPQKKPDARRRPKSTAEKRKDAPGRSPQKKADPSTPPAVAWHPELFQVPQEEGKTRFHDLDLPDPVLHAVADAIEISRLTVRNIWQNLFGAFVYNSLGIPVAAGVLYPFTGMLLNPMIAGAAMAMSSVTVVSNANRLRFPIQTPNSPIPHEILIVDFQYGRAFQRETIPMPDWEP